MLSIAVNVKNGEEYLKQCLNALSRFEDVVLLDNFSTDKTLEIAKNYPNVRIFEHAFCGMGKVRNMAASYAKYDWLMFVDCDEIVSPELADTLLNTQFADGSIYRILRYNYYDGMRIDTSSWGNDWILRLYNRTQTSFIENEVHDSFTENGLTEKKLHGGYLYHFPYNNISKLIDKMQFYSTLYAKQHFGRKKAILYSIPLRAFMMFFKCYILKRGFMQGFEGLAISSYNAMGVFSKYIKLYELSYKRKIALALDVLHEGNLPALINSINGQTLLPAKVFFLYNEHEFNPELKARLEEQLKQTLVVPFELIYQNGNNVAEIIREQLNPESGLQNIIYPDNFRLLDNHHFFKQCKTAVLKGQKILKTAIYSA